MRRREFLQSATAALTLPLLGGPSAAHPGPYRPLGRVAIENAREAVVGPDARTAYVAASDGFATVDVSVPSNPTVLAERRGLLADRDDGPLQQVYDVKVAGDRLVVAGPANPLAGDVVQGFLLYDVSDPANPERVAFHETDYPIHNCFVQGDHVYLTGNDDRGNPLVVVDIAADDPEAVGRWSLYDRSDRWREVAPNLRTVHDVWVQDDRAYVVLWDAGTVILDVSDPASPEFVSQFGGLGPEELADVPDSDVRSHVLSLPGNDHYVTVNDDATLLGVGEEAWVSEAGDGPGSVELWDISDERNPERVAAIAPPATSNATIAGTWTTPHNLELVGDRLYTSWYEGGVKIHDIADPANPRELAWWRQPEEASFWTARYATDQFFVGGSMGRRSNGKGGLYTFPNHAGVQKDAPELAPNASAPETTTAASTTEAEPKNASGVGGPLAFGPLAGLLGVAGGAWLAGRSRDDAP